MDRTPLALRLWTTSIWVLVGFFIVNLLAMIASVVVNSFGTCWFNTWLPAGFTTKWYASVWLEFQLDDILIVTFRVVGAVVLLSGLLGAYALARREFPGKRLVRLLILLPLPVPPITFGILAALLMVLVRTIAMFELTFFTAGPSSQTLVVALYHAVYAAGVRAGQSIDAMAVIYMATTPIWLPIALRFVNPTQLVTRVKKS